MDDKAKYDGRYDQKKDDIYKWWEKRVNARNDRIKKEASEEVPSWAKDFLKNAGYIPRDYDLGDTILSCVAKELREKYGLGPADKKELPAVKIWPKLTSTGGWLRERKEIALGKPVDFKDEKMPPGHIFGEEYSHFLRDYYCPPSEEGDNIRRKQVHEFFGMLGRRLLYQTGIPRAILGQVGPEGELVGASKDDYKKKMKRIRGELLYLAMNEGENDKSHVKRASELLNSRNNLRAHYFPYKYALNVDLSRIKDWEALYRMPDKEIRRRFFTKKPDYTGLDGTTVEKQEGGQGDLEKRVSVTAAILVGFSFLLFFLAGPITGHSIIENTKSFYFTFFPIILIVFSALFFLYFRNKKINPLKESS